jgi:hypothetical protein
MSTHRVAALLAPVVIAVVLGPLLAGLTIGLVAFALDLLAPGASLSLADHADLLLFYSIMAYFIGWPVALLAGLFVSLWMIQRPPSGLVVNAAAVIATVVFMGVAATGVLGPVEQTNGRSNFLFTLVAAVVAANVCWLLMRRFALKPAHGDAK